MDEWLLHTIRMDEWAMDDTFKRCTQLKWIVCGFSGRVTRLAVSFNHGMIYICNGQDREY